jgi:sulfur-carrier protein
VREDGGDALRIVVRLASPLRPFADGADHLELELAPPTTVGAVLDAVAAAHPAIGRRVRDEAGALRRHVNVFVGADNARDLDDTDTLVPDGTEVSVLPAISGG